MYVRTHLTCAQQPHPHTRPPHLIRVHLNAREAIHQQEEPARHTRTTLHEYIRNTHILFLKQCMLEILSIMQVAVVGRGLSWQVVSGLIYPAQVSTPKIPESTQYVQCSLYNTITPSLLHSNPFLFLPHISSHCSTSLDSLHFTSHLLPLPPHLSVCLMR